MMKKLGIVVMAGLFSVSVAGLSFADEMKKHEAAPVAAPANPCVGKEMKKEEKKSAPKKKKAAPKAEEAPAAAPAPAPAPAPAKK